MAVTIALSGPRQGTWAAWLWGEYKDALRVLVVDNAYTRAYTITRLTVLMQFTTAIAVVAAVVWITKKGGRHG